MRKLVFFLIRKKLGLKKYEKFRFIGQKTDAIYYFTECDLRKCWRNKIVQSGVSVNWLLDDECKIYKYDTTSR